MSCSSRREETQQPITFVLKTIAESDPEGCKPPDSVCVSFAVSFPVFSGSDSAASRTLAAVIDTALMQDDKDAHGKSMQTQANDFLRQYQEFRKAMPGLSEPWFYKGKLTPQVVGDSLISITIQEEYYTGGAHGVNSVRFINIQPHTGARVTLGEVLKPGYEAVLTSAGEKVFRQDHKLAPTESLLEHSFEFPDDKFKLPANYGFSPEGIIFYYNSYEIGSYAAGPTQLVIPYSALADVLPVR